MIRSLTRAASFSRHQRMLLALPVTALAVTLAACGSSGAASRQKPAGVAHSHTTHSAPAHHAVTKPKAKANPIPQGNGGDHDSDNNGGPSDGDGNI